MSVCGGVILNHTLSLRAISVPIVSWSTTCSVYLVVSALLAMILSKKAHVVDRGMIVAKEPSGLVCSGDDHVYGTLFM